MDNNPLKQYFRRPAIYVQLPSRGRFYGTDVFQPTDGGDIPIYPMTAIDEITSKTPDAVFSGQAVVDIIQSCVPNVKNAWQLNIIDIEALIIAIRVASHGESMEVTSTCPACENEANFDVNLVNMLGTQRDVNYEEKLRIQDLEVQFRPLTFREVNENNLRQYDLQKIIALLNRDDQAPEELKQEETTATIKKLNDLLNSMVCDSIEHISTPETVVKERAYIQDFLQHCDRRSNQAIKDHSIKLKTQNDIQPLKLKCMNCEHEYQQDLVLNISNFFG
jgi:hypothetical protein